MRKCQNIYWDPISQSVNGITGWWIFRTGRCLQNVDVKNMTTKIPLSYIYRRWNLLELCSNKPVLKSEGYK